MNSLLFPFLLQQNKVSLRLKAFAALYRDFLSDGKKLSSYRDAEYFGELFELRMLATDFLIKARVDIDFVSIRFDYLASFESLDKQVGETLKVIQWIGNSLFNDKETFDFEAIKNLKYTDYIHLLALSLPTKQAHHINTLLSISLRLEFVLLACMVIEKDKIILSQAQAQDIAEFLKVKTEHYAALMSLIGFWELPTQESQTVRNIKIVKALLSVDLGFEKQEEIDLEQLKMMLCV
jgi:hypothetical protein